MQKLDKMGDKNYKNEDKMLAKQISVAQHENQVLNIKLKEKDQEIKLNDLKSKELKKQIPNTRLRPLKGKRRTVDDGRPRNLGLDSNAGSFAAGSQKPRYDPMDHSTVSSKKRLNPLHSSLPMS